MDDFNREEWLKGLKIGDEVANESFDRWDRMKYYTFYKIKNITKKGNIRLDNNILLNNNGEYHKYDNWGSKHYKIEPATEEIINYGKERIAYLKLSNEFSKKCEDHRKFKINKDDMKTIIDIFNKYEKK